MSLKKYLPYFVQTAGVIAPAWTAQFTFDLFVTPQRIPRPGKEEAFWSKCIPIETASGASCRKIGEGPEIWFIHGWSGRGSQLFVLADAAVKAGFTALLYDAPAHGDTPGKKANMIMIATWMRKDIEARMKETGIKPFGLVGHSLGGAVVTYLCMTGVPVRKLVSIAAPAAIDRVFTTYWKNVRLPKKAQDIFAQIAFDLTGVRVNELNVDRLKDKMDTDVLIVHDDQDKEVSYEHTAIYKKARPDAEIFTTKNLGHRRILHSDIVAEKLVQFFLQK